MLAHSPLHIELCNNGGWESQSISTDFAIDDRLIEEAQKLGRHRRKKETVTAALDAFAASIITCSPAGAGAGWPKSNG
jgi:hypothetical protein